MDRPWWRPDRSAGWRASRRAGRLLTDGGDTEESDADEEPEEDGDGDIDRATTEVTEVGESEPADPKWKKPDLEEIPEFEVRADQPRTSSGESTPSTRAGRDEEPTAGMPNTARNPGDSRIKREDAEGYIAALELCARLPEDIRLPEQAADLVPAAVEAELEGDIQAFTATEFDNRSPTVDVLEFVERDGEIWLRLRLGIPPTAFADLDPDAVREHALEELDGLL